MRMHVLAKMHAYTYTNMYTHTHKRGDVMTVEKGIFQFKTIAQTAMLCQ